MKGLNIGRKSKGKKHSEKRESTVQVEWNIKGYNRHVSSSSIVEKCICSNEYILQSCFENVDRWTDNIHKKVRKKHNKDINTQTIFPMNKYKIQPTRELIN